MNNSFKTLVDSTQEILILLSNRPLMDEVAGGLSLYLSLIGAGKNVTISCSTPMTAGYSRLVGIDKVTTSLEGKNLIISFVNYPADDVDKVKADIENGKFVLTAIPKPGKKSPTRDQIEISYTGITEDLIILIGGVNDSHFPSLIVGELKKPKIVHVGIKLLEVLKNDLEVLSFARPASSVSEIVAGLINESSYPIDADIATNLLAGIEDRSKNFQSSETTAETFEVFASLLKLGGKRMPKSLRQEAIHREVSLQNWLHKLNRLLITKPTRQ